MTDRDVDDSKRFGRVVADVDVLAADLFVDGPAREAIDILRRHSWLTLLASEPLLEETQTVIAELGDPSLAIDWNEKIRSECELVDHPEDDQPAIATAYHGQAVHVLSFDDDLRSAQTGASIRPYVETSVKHPKGFARLFDPESIYPEVVGGEYPGPDRDPRM
ncbi:MAG: PIN domain-containing protein [Halobacteriales archaeon]